jgi:hypothetical protein
LFPAALTLAHADALLSAFVRCSASLDPGPPLLAWSSRILSAPCFDKGLGFCPHFCPQRKARSCQILAGIPSLARVCSSSSWPFQIEVACANCCHSFQSTHQHHSTGWKRHAYVTLDFRRLNSNLARNFPGCKPFRWSFVGVDLSMVTLTFPR